MKGVVAAPPQSAFCPEHLPNKSFIPIAVLKPRITFAWLLIQDDVLVEARVQYFESLHRVCVMSIIKGFLDSRITSGEHPKNEMVHRDGPFRWKDEIIPHFIIVKQFYNLLVK